MKVNTPEKIYLQQYDEDTLICLNKYNIHEEWTEEPTNEKIATNIEYTRTDAFIKKACDFFEENIEEEDCKIGSSEWTELRAEYKSLDSFIRAFVEYMKGE